MSYSVSGGFISRTQRTFILAEGQLISCKSCSHSSHVAFKSEFTSSEKWQWVSELCLLEIKIKEGGALHPSYILLFPKHALILLDLNYCTDSIYLTL